MESDTRNEQLKTKKFVGKCVVAWRASWIRNVLCSMILSTRWARAMGESTNTSPHQHVRIFQYCFFIDLNGVDAKQHPNEPNKFCVCASNFGSIFFCLFCRHFRDVYVLNIWPFLFNFWLFASFLSLSLWIIRYDHLVVNANASQHKIRLCGIAECIIQHFSSIAYSAHTRVQIAEFVFSEHRLPFYTWVRFELFIIWWYVFRSEPQTKTRIYVHTTTENW